MIVASDITESFNSIFEKLCMAIPVKKITDNPAQLAESPVWDPIRQVLYWTDIPAGQVWKYDPDCGRSEMVWQGTMMIGGLTLAEAGLILYGNQGIWRGYWQADGTLGGLISIFDIKLAGDERFNDVIADPRGRVFAGTLTERRADCSLFLLKKGCPEMRVLSDIGNSNGLGFSPDLKWLYHTDTQIRTIKRYEYDIESGRIEHPKLVFEGKEENGKPDGMTVDCEGCLWVACYYAGKVLRLDSDGNLLKEIEIPAKNVTSVAFGGSDFQDLYITTARNKSTSHASDGGGNLYCCTPGVKGRAEWIAQIG